MGQCRWLAEIVFKAIESFLLQQRIANRTRMQLLLLRVEAFDIA